MKKTTTLDKAFSWQIFKRIAPKYDKLNHILSFGMDHYWRKRLVSFLPRREGLRIVDVATGTADIALLTAKSTTPNAHIIAIDLSSQMLAIGKNKIENAFYSGKISLVLANAESLPFSDGSVDVITCAFGIRNMQKPENVLNEMRRVLCKNGRLIILEFSTPKNKYFKFIESIYLSVIVPSVGYLLAGDKYAYNYLNLSIKEFPSGEKFISLLKNAEFKDAMHYPLSGGVAMIYCACN